MSRPKFKILKKSKKSRARLGIVETKHGVLETPAFFPVATQGAVKTLDSTDIKNLGFQGILANTYHLMLRPGSDLIKKQGGLHKFINFKGVLATDSGGFQVFSLGKALEYGVGKIPCAKTSFGVGASPSGSKLSLVKIRQGGAYFKSHLDGSQQFLSPEKSIKIQENLGADIIFAFDQPASPLDNQQQTKKAMERTHLWAQKCLKARCRKDQMLFGIVQGGKYRNLRKQSAQFIAQLNFDGFGIGGSYGRSYGDSKKNMKQVLDVVIPLLPKEKPRHLLGIGYLDDMESAIKQGVDLFDCVYPARMARHSNAITSQGMINLNKALFLTDKNPLDKNCSCLTCQNYSRGYLSHLIRANELSVLRLLTIHNLYFFKKFIDNIKVKLKNNKI